MSDELDRKVAEALGLTIIVEVPGRVPVYQFGERAGTFMPTRDWTAFGIAFLWAAEKGIRPDIAFTTNGHWVATVWVEPGHFVTDNAPDPRIALCKALVAWKEAS